MATSHDPNNTASGDHVHLDGRTLEGGGQVVRNALALSALTGRPVTIDHVRGNRGKKPGLMASHAAAVKLLAEISGSEVSDGTVGSTRLTFIPPQAGVERDLRSPGSTQTSGDAPLVSLTNLTVQSEYNIRLQTPGSVFLIFQALYPYLLHVGSRTCTECIKVNITGGTNGTSSPSYDYAFQVMAPNFARLGLRPFSMILHKRGWSTGVVGMGEVSFFIHPLPPPDDELENMGALDVSERDGNQHTTGAAAPSRFPQIRIMDHKRGKITRITVTILATNDVLHQAVEDGETLTVARYTERQTLRRLRKALKALDPSIFEEPHDGETRIPVKLLPTEVTSHFSRLYILIVAHTSTGFRIGHDALLGDNRGYKHAKRKLGKHEKHRKGQGPPAEKGSSAANLEKVSDMIDGCVQGFIEELVSLQTQTDQESGSTIGKRSCLDRHMRDQIVVFEALGNLHRVGTSGSEAAEEQEDERYWTLHTKTAQWVCRKMLNVFEH
ncbi:uncharacterized protein N7482_002988 [Penicillium canariense]|uniref:RNA 3'-terminal phosphate cyclase domain-containing protein n=1 Tax=Penicillium canariense TaxID=189055 RepID=A0A9W9LUJ1_9EURO|nr:uncharacterized protein N7482_002988 [Penicillium canariense]KAJ5177111.1 hypothetical protein N7482_002988 [Penicillium canariense]